MPFEGIYERSSRSPAAMKSVDYNVPFYSNTPDDTHCFQAALKMILKYFWPDKDFTWEELEKITGKKEGLWTWPMAGMLWLKNNNFDVKNIEVFDYKKFIESPAQYLIDTYGKEVGEAQIKHSDLSQEIEYAKEFLRKISTENRIPTLDDIKKLLSNGYLVGCNVNSYALNKKLGYAGHFVIIKGFNNNELVIHDPGLPPRENRVVDSDTFEKAWAYPNELAKGIMAFRFFNPV